MAITRQRKILVGVLVVGLCAVATDRLLLSQPLTGADEASAELVTDVGVAAAVAAAPKASSQAQAAAALARRLEGLSGYGQADGAAARDAFQAPASWFAGGAGGSATVGHGAGPGESYELQAVMSDTKGGVAVVNGRSVRVGQRIEGAELVEIRRRSAVFCKAGQTFTVELPGER